MNEELVAVIEALQLEAVRTEPRSTLMFMQRQAFLAAAGTHDPAQLGSVFGYGTVVTDMAAREHSRSPPFVLLGQPCAHLVLFGVVGGEVAIGLPADPPRLGPSNLEAPIQCLQLLAAGYLVDLDLRGWERCDGGHGGYLFPYGFSGDSRAPVTVLWLVSTGDFLSGADRRGAERQSHEGP